MFDVNLLTPPGIQSKENLISDKKNQFSKKINESPDKNKNDVNSSSNRYVLIVSVFIMILISSYFIFFENNYFKLDNFIQNKIDNSYDVEKIIFVLRSHEEDLILDYMGFSETTFNVQIRINNSNSFYDMLDELSEIVYDDVKGYKINNKFLISLTSPWTVSDSGNFDVNLISKELSDFNPNLKKEIYKDKLIIITDILQLFNSLIFLHEINAIQYFNINIEPIESLPHIMNLYKMIVY